jgi:DNA-binding GntR family transcriptional regulator
VVGSRDIASEHNELMKAVLKRNVAEAVRLHDEHVRATGRYAAGEIGKEAAPAT